jgi:hypothetical protein
MEAKVAQAQCVPLRRASDRISSPIAAAIGGVKPSGKGASMAPLRGGNAKAIMAWVRSVLGHWPY